VNPFSKIKQSRNLKLFTVFLFTGAFNICGFTYMLTVTMIPSPYAVKAFGDFNARVEQDI
jgi:hypothetical protein